VNKYIIILLILLNQSIIGQYNKIYFDNFTTENGLPDNYVNCILQDYKGWIWIGSGRGISRFDGIKFKKYLVINNDSSIISDILIRKLFESKNHTLFACAEEFGLAVYNRDKDCFERLLINDKHILTDVSVKDLIEDNDGNFWAATKNGIVKIDVRNQNIKRYSHSDQNYNSLINNYVRRIAFDNKQKLWIGTMKGLDKFDPVVESFIHYSKKNQILGDDILDIFIDSNKIYIGTTNNGIVIINTVDNSFYNYFPDQKSERSNKVNKIFKDRENKLWIGTRGGLFLIDNENKKQKFENNVLEDKSLVHNSVIDIMQDVKGDIWVGTRGGLSYMAKEKQVFEYYKAIPENNHYLNNSEIYCIWVDNSGKVWIGTENGGINILDRKSDVFRYLTTKNGLSNNCIKAINSDNKGNVFIGTFQGGLNIYNEKTGNIKWFKHNNNDKNSISNNIIWDIKTDKKGNIWIGTASGLDKYNIDKQSFTHYSEFDDLLNGVTWIGIDSENDLWLGALITRVFRPGYGIINSFNEHGRSFFVDSNGNNWIMTDNRGFVLYDKHKGALKVYDEKDGLACNQTYCMLEDNKGNLWISTSNGLSCFNPKTNNFKNYYYKDGIQGNQFHYGAAYRSNKGELLFGGINGLTIFNPEQIIENKYLPPVYITDFKIFNQSVQISEDKKAILKKSISETKEIKLPYKYNIITFEFAALNYTNSYRNKYRYKLEGFEKEWTETSDKRSVTYTNLNPGRYVFKVIACNDNGYWNNTGASINLIIKPPFYKRFWFIALIFCCIFGLLYIILFFIFKKKELAKALEFEKIKAQKLHELDSFKLKLFTSISHELKTPLTLIISPLNKILKNNYSNSEIKENLLLIEKNAKHLMNLITQLLDYRKLQEGKLKIDLKKGDIVQFCEKLLSSFENLMNDNNITYKFGSVQKKIITFFDPDKLKIIINNLISNAIRYNKQGGSISLYISMVFEPEKELNEKDERYIKIEVKDTGIGIDEKEVNKIFNRYFTKIKTEDILSSGIGLSFTKELVELHNGKIFVESKPGKGSTFTVMLPFVEDTNDEPIEYHIEEIDSKEFIKTKEFKNAQKNKKILLVVEDNEDVLKFIKSHFSKDYIVLDARNGKDGLDLAIKTIPDIVVSDIMMPVMDGKELCRKIKKDERTSHIPVILLTVLSSKENFKDGLMCGCDDYITKPFDIDILQTKIESLLLTRNALREKYSKNLMIQPSHVNIKTPDEKFIEKAIQIVEKYIDDPNLDIDMFVKEIGVSRMQLYRKMKALLNMTVKEFVNDIRLKRAEQIFSEKKIGISEVAYSVGFNDLSYFGKCFKRKYGLSPSDYVRKVSQKMAD